MMLFEYTKQEEIEVIGQRIKIYILERIYNYKVKEVKKYKEKIKLILKHLLQWKTLIAMEIHSMEICRGQRMMDMGKFPMYV